MNPPFCVWLEQTMQLHNLSSKALAEASGISPSTLSRLKNGRRGLEGREDLSCMLVSGLAALTGKPEQEWQAAIQPYLPLPKPDMKQVVHNLNLLISVLEINVNDLSRFLSFDPSYLSRIRRGQRSPADPAGFLADTVQFVLAHNSPEDTKSLAHLLQTEPAKLQDPEQAAELLLNWLEGSYAEDPGWKILEDFFTQLDQFDLQTYLLHIPPSCGQLPLPPGPGPIEFRTLEGFKTAELQWMAAVIAGPSGQEAVAYSDMPIEGFSKDPAFAGKWLASMGEMLKRGTHLHMIHNLDRSFYEMMVGLVSYIPLYMTGQVSPWYFRNFHDPVFCHFLRWSPAGAVLGEAVNGRFEHGRYLLTCEPQLTAYAEVRAMDILEKASPLMEIWRFNQQKSLDAFLESMDQESVRSSILSAPPIYTMPEGMLETILERSDMDPETNARLLAYAQTARTRFQDFLERGQVTDRINTLDKERFCRFPVSVPAADLFLEQDLPYTWEEYQCHLQASLACAKENPNYKAVLVDNQPLTNIQVRMVPGKTALISKNKSPSIHFAIRHPRLRQAIENMTVHPLYDPASL